MLTKPESPAAAVPCSGGCCLDDDRATQILTREHRLIGGVLRCISRLAEQSLREGAVDQGCARDCLRFLRDFVAARHHLKEESSLFRAMDRLAPPHVTGTAAARGAHEMEHAGVRRMERALEDARGGNRDAVRRFADSARQFAALVQVHMHAEDTEVFRHADRLFSDADQAALLEQFRSAHAHGEDGVYDQLVRLAGELSERLGVLVEGAHVPDPDEAAVPSGPSDRGGPSDRCGPSDEPAPPR